MWSRARLVGPQPWPWPDRPRVLVEDPDPTTGATMAWVLRQAGFTVAVCPGPDEERREHPERCPLVERGECVLAVDADVIVTSLGLGRPEALEVLRALRERLPGKPLVVEASEDEARRHWELLEGCRVLSFPASPEALVQAVREAVAPAAEPAATA